MAVSVERVSPSVSQMSDARNELAYTRLGKCNKHGCYARTSMIGYPANRSDVHIDEPRIRISVCAFSFESVDEDNYTQVLDRELRSIRSRDG